MNAYNLDEIIFIPTGNPPHKKNINASGIDRYIMTSMATLTNDKFSVSDIEINQNEKSYSLNTITKLKEIYNDTEFFFITGTDAVLELPTWHKPEKLLSLCTFVAVIRPGLTKDEILKKIKKLEELYKTKILLLKAPLIEISSTDIRERMKKNGSIKYLLPENVEQYIIKNKLYGVNMDLELIKDKLKEKIPESLYLHSLSVMEESRNLAINYKTEPSKAMIAGLLHDCGKQKNLNDNLTHSSLGAQIAMEQFNIIDEDILNAITYHTTGRENMTMLEKIVFIADKIEPKRNYEGVLELRKIAYNSIDEAIIKSIENTIEYLKGKNLSVDESSIKTLTYLRRKDDNWKIKFRKIRD